MQFRVRPSSKRSSNNELSLVQFPTSKSLMSADSPLPRSLGARIDQLESALNAFQESHKRERQVSNAGYVEVQRRLDKVEYKIFGAEQDIRQLSQIRQLKQPRDIAASSSGQPSKNQLMLLKQVLMQEKETQRQLSKYQSTQIEQLNNKLLRQEQQIRELIAEQRMHWEQRINGQEEELRQVEGLKNRKMQQQYQLMRGVIANAQRKIYEELQRKIRNETLIKDFVEERIFQVKQELTNQHRQTLASQTKFIKETKQSLETLFNLFSSTKKQLGEQLNETQKLTTGSIKRLSMALDIAREKSSGEVKQALQMHKEVANQLIELRNFVTTRLEQNRQIMNEFEQQTYERIQHGGGNNSSRVASGTDDERFSLFQKQINQWKSITQQKNLNVFKQISNTLKAMKLQWRKQNDELVSQVAALNQSLKSVKKQGPAELKKSVQALVSIFNNQFDVLAQELQTLTDMIAMAKRQNEKKIKEDLSKLREQITEQIILVVNQKSKQSAIYCDKAVSRNQENIKKIMSKEIKFATESLSQRIQRNQNSLLQMDTSIKKANLLTNSQLDDYSLKLKGFNDSYKDYLQQQRKEDMKKRMDLEQTMRKNASSLMDICYKKCQFLVDGLKKNIEVSQMKQKVQAAQALDSAKDQLKKQVQSARQEWQKQLSQGVQKLTKQRQTSQQMLQETMDQSINNAKRNLTNEIGNNKLEMEEKMNEIKTKSAQTEAQQEEKHIDLKNTVLQMLRDEKKLNEQNNNKTKQQVNQKISSLEKKLVDNQSETKNRQLAQKTEMQTYVLSEIKKVENTNQQGINKVKNQLEKSLNEHKQQTKIKISAIEGDSKKISEDKTRIQQESKQKNSQIEQKIKDNNQQLEVRIEEINKKIYDIDQRVSENQIKSEKQKVASTSQLIQKHKELDKKQIQTENKIDALTKDIQKMNQDSIKKIEEVNNKIADYQSNATKREGQQKKVGQNSLNQMKKDIEMKMNNLDLKIDNKDKQTLKKIQQINNKLAQYQSNTNKKEGQDKKVGQNSLKQMKKQFESKINNLEAKINEIQSKDKGDENEEAITNVRKSVNKLEAMVFSQQAKNKAMFDRLTEDVNKVSQNLTLLTNQMRQ